MKNSLLFGAPLFYPSALEWMWNYCIYLGPYTDSDGNTFDLGVHLDSDNISAAIVYGDTPGNYISGNLYNHHTELYVEARRRASELNLIINLNKLKSEIVSEYNQMISDGSKKNNYISNKILNIFELEYARILRSPNKDYTELREFIMFFIKGKFKKQIKFNIWTSMAFLSKSELTAEVIDYCGTKYNKPKNDKRIN